MPKAEPLRFCVLLPHATLATAKLVADAKGVSVGELIRRGLVEQCKPAKANDVPNA